MISKSKIGAIVLVAVVGLATPVLAQYGNPYGGGSAGYNEHNTTDYKLHKHKAKHAAPKMARMKDHK